LDTRYVSKVEETHAGMWVEEDTWASGFTTRYSQPSLPMIYICEFCQLWMENPGKNCVCSEHV
jgi:hypothetical protein